jgi:NhaA family Na+:H+ antiporter
MIFKKFFENDSASGILLIAAALAALLVYNSPLYEIYHSFMHTHLKVKIGELGVDKSLLHWINDGLMTIFFLTVGLEIKREMLTGALAEFKKALLPFIAALGGVIFPALIYTYFNQGNPETMPGWGIPVATDIAFAVGILALLGRHAPRELKILLLSLAIIDDLAAILIIAVFYTDNLNFVSLGMGGAVFALLMALNFSGVKSLKPYLWIGAILWFLILKSGVHATVAGVLLALAIPMHGNEKNDNHSPLKHLEHALYGWAAFFIMPLFAFANAGFSLAGFSLGMLTSSVSMGIILGLFFGKQIGVFSFIWIGDKLGIVQRPENSNWKQIYGLSLLTGIGFTVSLFIGSLAFSDPAYAAQVRFSVLAASTLSAICGYTVLRMTSTWATIEVESINPISHPEIFEDDNEDHKGGKSLSDPKASKAR